MFNLDSGLRPPSPPRFSPGPGHGGLFGEQSVGFEDYHAAPLMMPPPPLPSSSLAMPLGDPSFQLFNPSEQRYFSQFLDTLVDPDFQFDANAIIPNLPSLPTLASHPQGEGSSGGGDYMLPLMVPSQHQQQQNSHHHQQHHSMEYDYSDPNGRHRHHHQGVMINESMNKAEHIPDLYPVPPSTTTTTTGKRRKTGKTQDVSVNRKESGATNGSRTSNSDEPPPNPGPIQQQLKDLSLENKLPASKRKTRHQKREASDEEEEEDEGQEEVKESQQRSAATKGDKGTLKAPKEEGAGRKERTKSMSAVSDESAVSEEAGNGSNQKNDQNGGSDGQPVKRKPYKELLTEEEKRANHIASEQRRRNTIRVGFKDMTDIIPNLKEINSSKSTILFKAVDYIQYLERRIHGLQDQAAMLESRLYQTVGGHHHLHHHGHGSHHAHHHQSSRHHRQNGNGSHYHHQHLPSSASVSSSVSSSSSSPHPSRHIPLPHTHDHRQDDYEHHHNHPDRAPHHYPQHLQPSRYDHTTSSSPKSSKGGDSEDRRLEGIPHIYPVNGAQHHHSSHSQDAFDGGASREGVNSSSPRKHKSHYHHGYDNSINEENHLNNNNHANSNGSNGSNNNASHYQYPLLHNPYQHTTPLVQK